MREDSGASSPQIDKVLAAIIGNALKAITDEQLQKIYKTGYWDRCKCDQLENGVDYVVFDQAVNSGPSRSAKWLQKAIGTAVDGGIGPNTITAANASKLACAQALRAPPPSISSRSWADPDTPGMSDGPMKSLRYWKSETPQLVRRDRFA